VLPGIIGLICFYEFHLALPRARTAIAVSADGLLPFRRRHDGTVRTSECLTGNILLCLLRAALRRASCARTVTVPNNTHWPPPPQLTVSSSIHFFSLSLLGVSWSLTADRH